jgi:hypothetical protein
LADFGIEVPRLSVKVTVKEGTTKDETAESKETQDEKSSEEMLR